MMTTVHRGALAVALMFVAVHPATGFVAPCVTTLNIPQRSLALGSDKLAGWQTARPVCLGAKNRRDGARVAIRMSGMAVPDEDDWYESDRRGEEKRRREAVQGRGGECGDCESLSRAEPHSPKEGSGLGIVPQVGGQEDGPSSQASRARWAHTSCRSLHCEIKHKKLPTADIWKRWSSVDFHASSILSYHCRAQHQCCRTQKD
eukprot:1294504-Rhodomonas_salina.3